QWEGNAQAVSNLLSNPDVIADDGTRRATILRGLRDERNRYYNLAGQVGLQRTQQQFLPLDAQREVRSLLLAIARRTIGLPAQRALATIFYTPGGLVPPQDTLLVCRLLDHPDRAVRLIAQAWVIHHLRALSDQELSHLFTQAQVACKAKQTFFVTK